MAVSAGWVDLILGLLAAGLGALTRWAVHITGRVGELRERMARLEGRDER